MPTITKRKWDNGETNFIAVVRIKGFKTTAKTFDTKAAATEWAASLEKELRTQRKRGGARADVSTLSVGGLVREYLADDRTKSLRSFKGTERLLGWWVNKYANIKVIDFGADSLLKARTELRAGRSPATTNRYLSAMRSCWAWGRAMHLVAQERTWPIRLLLKEPRGRTRFLNDGEIDALLTAAAPDPVMYAAILVSIATGVRKGELLRLTWADLDLVAGKLTVRESKNGEMRAVHLPANAIEALKKLKKLPLVSATHVLLDTRNGKPLSRSRLEYRWPQVRNAAKLADFRWHDLRHTCASVLVQAGASLPQVGSVLGHKSLNMTMRYSHLIEGAAVTGHDVLNTKLGPRGK
jgi:integrase